MRSEDEMFSLIINSAKEDKRIRAAYLCGSKVNPDAQEQSAQNADYCNDDELLLWLSKDLRK